MQRKYDRMYVLLLSSPFVLFPQPLSNLYLFVPFSFFLVSIHLFVCFEARSHYMALSGLEFSLPSD